MAHPEKILLVTERPLLALNFRELLESAGWGVAPVVVRPEGLQPYLSSETPALVVIDSETEVAWDAVGELCARMTGSRFVVWCAEATPQLVQASMQAGMHGLLSLRLAIPEAAQALLQIWQGERHFRFDGELQPRVSEEPALTPREQQIVALVMDGRRNREIAEALHTTEGSVKVHINRLFWKTGAKNREELARAGRNFLRRTVVRSGRHRVPRRTDAPFDASWMFSSPSDSRNTGEVSYDSIER